MRYWIYLHLFILSNILNAQELNRSVVQGDYHRYRSGLQNSQIKFEREKSGRVAFLGGSITYNPGWRDSVMQYLERRFPETKFDFIAAGIPSMGTTPAAFRLERDVFKNGPVDLLFEEAAVNDATNSRTSEEQVRAMEGIVRHVRRVNPKTDIVIMHFVDPDKMETYRRGSIPEVIANHEKVARHYDIPSINLAKEVTDRIDNHEFTWEDDFKDLHPSPFGQGIYANSIIRFLKTNYLRETGSKQKMNEHSFPAPIDPNNYDHGHLVDVRQAKYSGGWTYNFKWIPEDGTGTRPNYTHVPMLVSTGYDHPLTFEFEGRAVGIAIAAGSDAGTIKFSLDEGDWISLNLKTKWSDRLHLPWFYTLHAELEDGKHKLDLKLVHPEGDLQEACRIRYFYVNE